MEVKNCSGSLRVSNLFFITLQDQQIVQCLAEQTPYKKIARLVGLEPRAVEYHIVRLRKRWHCDSVVQLLELCRVHKVIK